MSISPIPNFCLPCIQRMQAACPHLHASFRGGWHYNGQDVWDDLNEVCDDCGADLDELARIQLSQSADVSTYPLERSFL